MSREPVCCCLSWLRNEDVFLSLDPTPGSGTNLEGRECDRDRRLVAGKVHFRVVCVDADPEKPAASAMHLFESINGWSTAEKQGSCAKRVR